MKIILRLTSLLCLFFTFSGNGYSQITNQATNPPRLTHQMTPDEYSRRHEIGRSFIQTDPPAGEVTNLAEFNRASGAVVAYPFGIPLSLIREMAKDAKVTTLVPNASAEATVRNLYTQARVNLDNCAFLYISTNSYWTRDFGPMYITYGDKQIGIVDFPYNRPRPLDDDAPRSMAQMLGIEWFGMPVIHTGGNYMTDGHGLASSTTIAYTENPDISSEEVNQRMLNYLGITDYSVLADPNNTYIDHIDCWGKYLAPDKVLIRSVPASHPQYDAIEQTAAYYANKISIYGTPYKVYRVYTPQNQPYTNSYILNDKVFVPIMNSLFDEQALQAYRDAMPGYKVFGIIAQPSTPWESTDALHCRTHEMADMGMLYMKHIPILGNAPIQSSYTLTANIKAYSNEPIIADSVLLYYRVNPNPLTPFSPVVMTTSGGDLYSATITSPEAGSTIQYYLFAADNSGRREYLPFIGSPDPHEFYVGTPLTAQADINPGSLAFTAMKDTEESENLTLNNTGQIGLNYNFTVSTDINDTLTFNLSNSPSANSYNSNTFNESGWTTFTVAQQEEVSNLLISYQWNTDDYYTEGSIWIESPTGTQYRAGAAQLDGYYSVSCPDFIGETMNGDWKVWIEDSYGDGGHQATNIKVKIIKLNPTGNWLSIDSADGIVPAGSSAEIHVTANADSMEIGNYEGLITLYSNDPEEESIQIPVSFRVTINTSSAPEPLLADCIEVNPNPFSDKLTVSLNSMNESRLTLELFDIQGSGIYQSIQTVTAGEQQLTIPASNIRKGLYILRVTSGNQSETFKLIKL